MSGMESTGFGDVSALTQLEDQLAEALAQASGEVARMECFDVEQRAEVYAILETLKTDTAAHRVMVDKLTSQLVGDCGNA